MIGDKVLIQKHHKLKAKRLLYIILEKYKIGNKFVIAIGGESGTGKTEIALILRNLLYKNNIRVQIISIDDYYKTNFLERNKIRQNLGIDSIGCTEIMWDKLNKIIHNFKDPDSSINIIRRINKFTNSIEYVKFFNASVDILIVEGLYALFCNDVDLRIYLDGSYIETKAFRLERKKEEQTPFRELVLKKERQDILKSRNLADIIVSLDGNIYKNN